MSAKVLKPETARVMLNRLAEPEGHQGKTAPIPPRDQGSSIDEQSIDRDSVGRRQIAGWETAGENTYPRRTTGGGTAYDTSSEIVGSASPGSLYHTDTNFANGGSGWPALGTGKSGGNTDQDDSYWHAYNDGSGLTGHDAFVDTKSYRTTGEVHARKFIVQDRPANVWENSRLNVDVTGVSSQKWGSGLSWDLNQSDYLADNCSNVRFAAQASSTGGFFVSPEGLNPFETVVLGGQKTVNERSFLTLNDGDGSALLDSTVNVKLLARTAVGFNPETDNTGTLYFGSSPFNSNNWQNINYNGVAGRTIAEWFTAGGFTGPNVEAILAADLEPEDTILAITAV